jgi:flagellar motor switch protein FliG
VTHAAAAGPDTAREILVRAFGTDEGERRFYEVLPEERPARFAFLADADGKQLTMMLRGESAATLATIASHVPQKTAARLLEALPAASKIEVVRRMATIQAVDATVLDAIESSLRRRMESIERPDAEEARIDGEERLAEILRYLDMHTSDAILTSLTHSSPDTAEHIRDRMTTLDDLLLLTDQDLQTVLARVDDVDLAVALKGASAPVVERISTNLSDRRREMVEMHRASFGPMHRRDVDRITADLVELVRQAAREGEIVIRSAGEEYV